MIARVLVDTGPLVAILSKTDLHHAVCAEQLRTLAPPLYTCWPVVTEAAYLLRRETAVVQQLLGAFDTGLLSLLPLDEQCPAWISQFLTRYEALKPQLADACLMYLAERDAFDTIFTLDRRDFTVFRLSNGAALTLLPELL